MIILKIEEDNRLLLTPGQKITFVNVKCGEKYRALVRKEEKTGVVVALDQNGPFLEVGDEVELEVPQKEDALYVGKALVKKITREPEFLFHLHMLSNFRSVQRRSAERMLVKISEEHMLLKEGDVEKAFKNGVIINLSKTGVLLAVKEPIEVGSELFLSFELPFNINKTLPMGVVGKVVREHKRRLNESPREMKYSYGIKFEKHPATKQGIN